MGKVVACVLQCRTLMIIISKRLRTLYFLESQANGVYC